MAAVGGFPSHADAYAGKVFALPGGRSVLGQVTYGARTYDEDYQTGPIERILGTKDWSVATPGKLIAFRPPTLLSPRLHTTWRYPT